MTYGLVVDRRSTFVSGDPGFDSWLDGRSSLISYRGTCVQLRQGLSEVTLKRGRDTGKNRRNSKLCLMRFPSKPGKASTPPAESPQCRFASGEVIVDMGESGEMLLDEPEGTTTWTTVLPDWVTKLAVTAAYIIGVSSQALSKPSASPSARAAANDDFFKIDFDAIVPENIYVLLCVQKSKSHYLCIQSKFVCIL